MEGLVFSLTGSPETGSPEAGHEPPSLSFSWRKKGLNKVFNVSEQFSNARFLL